MYVFQFNYPRNGKALPDFNIQYPNTKRLSIERNHEDFNQVVRHTVCIVLCLVIIKKKVAEKKRLAVICHTHAHMLILNSDSMKNDVHDVYVELFINLCSTKNVLKVSRINAGYSFW